LSDCEVCFDDRASRPTLEMSWHDAATGPAYTELVTPKVAGKPQLHMHVCGAESALIEGSRAGGVDLQRLEGGA